MKKAICLVGLSGSGKGTVSALLSQMTGWPILSTGDLIREESKKDTLLGKRCLDVLENHKFLPWEDQILLDRRAISNFGDVPGIIFEGSPRSVGEALFIAQEADAVFIYLDVPEDLCRRRLLMGRKRSDDTPHGISGRFAEFRRVFPGIREVVRLYNVDGSRPPNEVVMRIEFVFRYWLFPGLEIDEFTHL